MARNGRSAATLDPFIVATGRESIKPEGQTRKYIRSHVMQGKNKGKGKGIKKSGMRQQQNTSQSLGLAVGSSPSGIDYMRPDLTPSPERALCTAQARPSSISAAELIQEFVAAMKSAMYPIERHVGIGTDEPGWLSKTTMCRDTDYAQIVAYSALAFFDTAQQDVKSGHNNQRALIHMTRGIQLLRKRVSMLDFSSTDATIFLALALGMFSEAHDELEAAQKHLSGLFQLVRLRGGIKALSDRRFLQIKCCRLDLAIALRTGNQPLFFADEGDDLFSQASLLSANKSAVLTPPLPFIVDPGMSDMDRRVIGVWQDLRTFTTAVNFARQTDTKISPDLFQEVLISVHYRLHKLYPKPNVAREADTLRLAMLSFSTTFFLEVHSDKFQNLSVAFQSSLQARHIKQKDSHLYSSNTNPRLQELDLWMIFVAALSVLNGPEYRQWLQDELRTKMNNLRLTDWDATATVLKRFLWVESIHDGPAKSLFESLSTT